MEELKALATLTEPDGRHRFFAIVNKNSQTQRPLALADVYERAAQCFLHVGVPERVRSHFATAQNLIAYSWFYYPFNVVAELHAYISVEFALRTRYPESDKSNFKDLLARAVADGLLSAERFTYGQASMPEPIPGRLAQTASTMESETRGYVDGIVEAMRTLRNDLAHGSTSLHMDGCTVLYVCSEIINQLFPEPA